MTGSHGCFGCIVLGPLMGPPVWGLGVPVTLEPQVFFLVQGFCNCDWFSSGGGSKKKFAFE